MQLFDVHNHLQDTRLDADRDAVMQRATEAGVVRMVVCGTTEEDWPAVRALAQTHGHILPSYGLHPWWVAQRTSGWRESLTDHLQSKRAAIGEIGLDHALRDRDDADQEAVFMEQIALSHEQSRPVSIHCRRAWDRMLELLQGAGPHPEGYLLHAYSGGAERVERLVSLNAYFSFGGSLTYSGNKRGPRALQAVPPDRLLLETDAPDMAPADCDRCEPAHIRHALRAAARNLNLEPGELARQTFANSERLFARLLT